MSAVARSSAGRTREVTEGFRADVEGLRAVAVTLVVAFHARHSLVPGGYIGVDVFFVLSGFLITGLLLREFEQHGRVSLSRFWARRIRRLLPLSSLVLICTLAGTWLIIAPINRGAVAASARAAALYQANWHFASQANDYFAASVETDPVLHYWSLSLEEQYYVVWPLILTVLAFAAMRIAPIRRRPRATAAVLLGVIAAGSLALSMRMTTSDPAVAYYALRTRAWELAIGALVAVAAPLLARAGGRWLREAAAVGGLLAILIAAVAFSESTPFPGSAALLPVLGTAAVVAAGAGRRPTLTGRMLGLAVPRYIGRVSYGWYLWHWPCLVLAEAAFTNRYGVVSAANDTRYQLVVMFAVVLSLGLAVVSHYAVETPVRRSVRLSRAPRLTLAFGASLTVATAALAVTLHRGIVAPAPSAAAAAVVADQAQLATAATRLSEDPAVARADWGVVRHSCLSHEEVDARIVCVFGDPKSTTRVLLTGDSHAASYVPGMARLAARRHWRLEVIEASACPIWNFRVWHVGMGENVGCEKWRRRALARIAASKPFDLVLIAVAESERPGVLRDDGSHPPPAELPSWWATGARRTVALMAPVARRIVVIGDPPLPGFDVPACLSAHPTDIGACQYSHAQRAYLDADLLAAAAPGLAPFGVLYADLAPLLCPAATCPVVTRNGTIMFKDAGHFTASYSRALWPLLGTAIDAASPTPPHR